MEPTQALNFNIPKLKRQVTKDNLFEIDSNSRDAKELLASVSRTYLDLNYSGPWRVKTINMVHNTELEQDYKSKRTDMKEEGRHSRELVDQIAFCAIKEQCYITKIAKNGMMTQNLPFSIIGDFKSGVYLTKHADVQLKMVETISSQTITALFIFNTMLGKCKVINERVMSAAEPTPNFDCHVPLQPAQPGDPHVVQLQRSQIFFYEYDNDGMPVSRPRQCLPYAVITYEKVENFTMGPLKSIYCYDPMKNSSQIKKPEDKPDWKKSPRNVTNAQLPFPKNQPSDNPTRTPLPFPPVGWVSTQDAGTTNLTTFTTDSSQDTESGSNQCGVSVPNVLFNYPQQNTGADTQGVVVHRSASDPRRRFNQNSGGWNTDEPAGAAEQQRNIPPPQLPSFPNFQVGYQGGFDQQFPQMDQNKDGGFGWQPKPPQGFYNECEPIDNSSQPWYQSPVCNNSNNNFNNNNYLGNNNNNYLGNNNNNYMGNNNNYMGNNNNNYMGNNKDDPSGWNDWNEPRFGNSETKDPQKLKPVNLNCDNKPNNNTDNKPSTDSSSTVKKPPVKRPIPFALNKKKPKPASDTTTSQQKSQSGDSQDVKSKDSSPVESDPKKTLSNAAASTQKKDTNSTDSDSTKKPEIKVLSETVEKKIPFPKKSSAPKVTEELAKPQTKLSDTYVQELFDKLYQAEFKDNVGASNFGGVSSGKGNSVKAKNTTEQISDKTFSVHDVSEADLRKLQDYIKTKIELKENNAKNVPKQSTNNEPKIKTTVSSLKQGLKTTILLPTPGKKTEENLPSVEDLKKLLNIVDKAVNIKTEPLKPINIKTEPLKLKPNEWETSYQSFLKTVQKKQLIPGQHHKWVRKKELPPEPPLPETVPPPTAEVSIDDVVNTKLMKELLLEQEFSESTSVSEADSLYLPPTEERKKRKTNSGLTTRRQTRKKAAFDMTSYRRRRKRQKMQRKAAADFGASSLALTTNTSGLDDNVYNFWDPNFKGPEIETSLNDDLLSYNKEGPSNVVPTNKSLSKGPTLKELGFNNWKDAMVSLKFQPVVALKNCVQQITSHLQQEGSSNVMEWVGSQKELRETLNLPPDNSLVALSSANTSKSTNSSSSKSPANAKVPTTTVSKSSTKTKVTKNIAMEYQSMSDTISINSIKASVRSEITKIKKTAKSVLSDTDKKKISKPKPAVAEIPRIKAKLPPEKSFTPSAKSDTPLQHSTNNPKEVKKPTLTSGLLSQNPQPKPTVSTNKTLPPKGIIKNSRPDSAVTKTSLVSPATFPATDQSLKVDLLMESISAPPTSTPSILEAEQKRLAEQKKAAEQKKQKISFQAYMEKKIKTKPAKSPPREKTNVFETFKDFLSPEPDNVKKTISEPPITPPILIPPPTIAPVAEKLKPSLVVPPVGSAFSNSVFSPRSPTPQVQVPRDPRIPSKLPLPFSKEPSLPKIIPTIPKKPKEELKSCLKEKPIKMSPTMSHRKAPPPKTIPISMDEVQEPSEAPVDPRLSRKLPSNQPELPSVKESLSKTPALIEPLLPRDPRLLKVYGDYQAEGVVSSKRGNKSPAQEGLPSIKLKPDPTEYVSDIIRKVKPPVKKDTWNLFTISTEDEVPKPTRKPFPTEEEASPHKASSRKKPGVLGEVIPAYAQFSKDVSIETRISSDEGTRIVESQEASVDRQSWGFYREMSLKMPNLENATSVSDKESKASTNQQKSDDNTCSDMDIVTESPKGLYFSDSDEDLTKPLYIDEGASGATPRRDSFENYNFSVKNTGRDLKTGRMDSRSSFASSQVLKTLPHFSENVNGKTMHADNFGIYSNSTLTPKDTENKKMSPFNETVPPADPESSNATGSSLFCAYQMEGKSELKDMSHIWMKSLSTLSQAKAVSSLEISDEVLDVLRKVVKENIPAGQKHLPQIVPFPTPTPTPNSTATAGTNIPKKPNTLDKDYKLGVLDKDLFHSGDLQKEFVKAEHVSLQESNTLAAGVNIDGKLETSQPGNSNLVKLEKSERNSLNEIYNPSNPIGDETTVKPPAGSMSDPQAFVPGQAIPVLSGKKQNSFHKGAKKSRSASPTTTAAAPAPIQSPNYFPQSSGWMTSQQPPFWLNQGLNQKFDGVWPNLPTFNPIVTGSIPWPPPLNVPPSHLTNIPFPLSYVPPDLPAYPPSQADSLKPPNLFDWFADKINPKAGTSNNDINPTKTNKSPRATSEINLLSSLSSKSTNVSENDTPAQAQSLSSNSADLTSGADTKTSRSNHGNIQIPKSESFTELASINSDRICGISKADPDKSRFSSYSPTSEIVSISASDPSMSPSALDSVKPAGKEVPFKLKRTFSMDSSLSSESSRSSKNDSLNKKEEKPMKSELANLIAATPPSSHDSEKSACPKAELTVDDPSIKPSTSIILDPSKQTSTSDFVPDLHAGDATISEKSTDLVMNKDSKKKERELNKDSKKSKSREERRREKKSTSLSTSSSKSSHASSGSSKSAKEAKLAKANRDKLRKLTRQFLKNNGKSDLQNLLKSVKQIKRELASQPSHEKGGSSEKSDRKSVHLPSRSKPASSEPRSSSSRTKKSSEKDERVWSEKFWKPIKSVEDDVLPSSSSSSTNKKTKSSSVGKYGTNKQNAKASATKTSEQADDIPKDLEEGDRDKPTDEAKNSDLELEEGELPDKESEESEDEAMMDVHSKHKSSSRRKEESSRRKRRQPDRRHTSHEERFYKRRIRQSPTEEGNPSNTDNYPYDRLDTYPYDSPDRYVHDRTENYMHSRMDNVDRYLGSRADYPHDGPDNCPPERSGFYPPNRMDRYNTGNPDNFDRGKRKRFRSKRGRPLRGKFGPFPRNNYSDQNFNDYSPENDRYPRDRKENYSHGESDRCISKTFGVSTDPDDYIQDESDGLLYEKSNEYGSFKQGYSNNWPERHRRRRRGSYSPSPDGDYSDGSFRGRGSPPRDEGPLHSGRHSGDGLPKTPRSREIKEDSGGSVGIRKSVSSDNLTADYFSETDKEMEPTMTGDQNMQTGSMQNEDDDDEKNMRDTFDTINSYILTYVKEGSAEYKILKKSLGMPLETKFDDMSKTKRKKIRKKIQSQLQALKQAPSISTNESDSTYFQSSERSSFKGDNDLQKSSTFEGKPNYLEFLNKWLNQRPDEDQYLHSRLDVRYDSEDDGKSSCFGTDTVEDLSIADPEIRQAVKTVAWMEKSSGFGTPHQRIPLNLLLAEEKDNMFSFEGAFLILMRKIPRKAVERLATLREVLNTLTCELQEAHKDNDIMKFQKLQATKNKLHDRRKYMLEKFTGWISPNRLQMIMEAKNIYQNCLEYLQRKPDPLPNIDREFVVKTIKAIQGHINLTKKFLDEQASSSNTTPSMSSSGFCPDMARPNPPDAALSWFGPRNMDPPMPGFFNKQPWNNAPF